MDWTQVDIHTTTEGIEPVGAALTELNLGGFSIQDPMDFEDFLAGKNGHWDYIDDGLMKLRDSGTTLTVYIPEGGQGAESLASIKSMLEHLKALDTGHEWGALDYTLTGVKEEDWATAWKKYYVPIKISERLVVCPSWEKYSPETGEVVLSLDPGMAFGTGTHASTRLCLKLFEDAPGISGGRILDIGCGSGILAVSALLLGAGSALGVDIDEVAVNVATENARLNHVEGLCEFRRGSLADIAESKFDVIFANIVADVIIALAPDIPRFLSQGGSFIASGIIDAREDDVLLALDKAGLRIVSRMVEDGWVGLRLELAG